MKDPMDVVIYQQLLWNEKPRAIFEIGTFTGGSAMWMAETMRSYGYDFHLYSVDIDSSLLDDRVKGDKNITFIKGDVNKIEDIFPVEMLEVRNLPFNIINDKLNNPQLLDLRFYQKLLNNYCKCFLFLLCEFLISNCITIIVKSIGHVQPAVLSFAAF